MSRLERPLRFDLPAGFGFGTAAMPGNGTLLWVNPGAPDPVPASYFNGLCLIGSADLIFGHADKSSSALMILDYYRVLGPAIIPY